MITNHEKLTSDFCRGKRLLFFPKTEAEASLIQRKLFGMGFRWPNGSAEVSGLEYCVNSGMLLTADGAVYHSPSLPDSSGLLCTADQFNENYLSPDMALLMAQFNGLAAQITEIAREVAEIKEHLQPQKLDKPSLKNKGAEQP